MQQGITPIEVRTSTPDGSSEPMSAGEELTLAGTIDHLRRRGFTEHFGVVGERLHDFGTRATFRPDEVRICETFRFEGVSNPDDMAVVYAIESRTGVRGTLADAFGVYSSPAISEFMERVAIGPADASRDRAGALARAA